MRWPDPDPDPDADVRSDAFDVFLAEAGRSRLVDRAGPGRLRLRCGAVLVGRLTGAAEIADHLAVTDEEGRPCQVPTSAVVTLTGAQARLRPEPTPRVRSLASWLREVGAVGGRLSVLDVSGEWHHGRVVAVGADHLDLAGSGIGVTLPFAAVEVWRV